MDPSKYVGVGDVGFGKNAPIAGSGVPMNTPIPFSILTPNTMWRYNENNNESFTYTKENVPPMSGIYMKEFTGNGMTYVTDSGLYDVNENKIRDEKGKNLKVFRVRGNQNVKERYRNNFFEEDINNDESRKYLNNKRNNENEFNKVFDDREYENQEIWSPPTRNKSFDSIKTQNNLGKVTINNSYLISSTEELLKLTHDNDKKMIEKEQTILNNQVQANWENTDKNNNNNNSGKVYRSRSMPIINNNNSIEKDSQPVNTKIVDKSNICKYFQSGFCRSGNKCQFSHINNTPVEEPKLKYEDLKLEEWKGKISTLCHDQYGCRFLQKKLDENDPSITEIIFQEVLNQIVEVMSGPFGNYLFQKLLDYCTVEQRLKIVKSISNDFVKISKNVHGTRSIQKLIESISTNTEVRLIRDSLKGSVVELIQDLNGNHVIQKTLSKLATKNNQFIYDAVAQHCTQVATHRHGCCVIQRCIDYATVFQKEQLIREISSHAEVLVQDAFGNYVVQYFLDLNIANLPTIIIKQLEGKLFYLSKQKFSSNVIEKCLKCGDIECVSLVMKELSGKSLHNPEESKKKLINLLQDSYGNYVIQTCLSEGSTKAPSIYSEMRSLILPLFNKIRNNPCAKRINTLLHTKSKKSRNKQKPKNENKI